MSDDDENKVVLIGESGVGKTCIINQFANGTFDEDVLASSTAQFCRKNFEFSGDKSITLDMWDTVGQEKYRSLSRILYHNAKVIILVYDITDKRSFNEVRDYWYKQIKENCKNEVIIAVAANKSDLYEQRQVEDEEGEEFAKSIGAFFGTTSAKNDSGITNLFENIATKLLDPAFKFSYNEHKVKKGETKSIKIEAENNKDNSGEKKKKKCC